MERFRTPGQWRQGPERYFDNPPPEVVFRGETFILTGTFALGERSAIEEQIRHLGGKVSRTPLKGGCMVVVGTLPTQGWTQDDVGRKLLESLELRKRGHFVFIISEDYFSEALSTAYAETPDPVPFEQRVIDFEKLLRMWLDPLEKEYSLNLVIAQRPGGFVAYPEGKKAQWICRFQTKHWTLEPRGMGKIPVSYLRALPEETSKPLRSLFAQAAAEVASESEWKPQECLSPEELQRRNTERKAAMRAKPVTPEVLEVAQEIISALEAQLPDGIKIEGQDRAKYYVLSLMPGDWLCRFHYKTKNKYIEVNGSKPEAVQNFACDAALAEQLVALLPS